MRSGRPLACRAVEELRYEFTAELWLYPGEAGWVFATLPVDDAEEIDELARRACRCLDLTWDAVRKGDY